MCVKGVVVEIHSAGDLHGDPRVELDRLVLAYSQAGHVLEDSGRLVVLQTVDLKVGHPEDTAEQLGVLRDDVAGAGDVLVPGLVRLVHPDPGLPPGDVEVHGDREGLAAVINLAHLSDIKIEYEVQLVTVGV